MPGLAPRFGQRTITKQWRFQNGIPFSSTLTIWGDESTQPPASEKVLAMCLGNGISNDDMETNKQDPLFCRYRLYSVKAGAKDYATAGLAGLGSICGRNPTSVNQDDGLFEVAGVAAHELGHRSEKGNNSSIPWIYHS